MDLEEHLETVNKLYEEMLQDIIEKTNKIHASLLFWGPLTNLLQKLSRIFCATPTSTRYNGWVELGVKLGLEDEVVKSIEHTQIMGQDPVYVMLLNYSQKRDSTVANIYFAISQLERKDIVCKTYTAVLEFHTKILHQFTIPSDEILRAPKMPEVPHIFKNLEPKVKIKDITTKPKEKRKHFKKVVLLTYVPERNGNVGRKGIVEKVVEEFRKELNGISIGVLMLEENRRRIIEDRNMVQYFYKRANYIIPILTIDYLTHITGGNSSIDNLDGEYATYIYSQMMLDYLKSGCKNKKVRCIIPDDDFENVKDHYFFQPLFQAWTKEKDIAKMAKDILDGKI